MDQLEYLDKRQTTNALLRFLFRLTQALQEHLPHGGRSDLTLSAFRRGDHSNTRPLTRHWLFCSLLVCSNVNNPYHLLSSLVGVDPGFVDAVGGDFRLQVNSGGRWAECLIR